MIFFVMYIILLEKLNIVLFADSHACRILDPGDNHNANKISYAVKYFNFTDSFTQYE